MCIRDSLVVGLQARRQRPVGDRAHIGLVDPHAKRVRRHHNLGAAFHKRGLARAARVLSLIHISVMLALLTSSDR